MKTRKHTYSCTCNAVAVLLAVLLAICAAPSLAVDTDKSTVETPAERTVVGDADTAGGDVTVRDLVRRYFKDGKGEELAQVLGWQDEAKQVIALDYTVLLWNPAAKLETAVHNPGDHQFNIGDSIRVTIEPLTDAYIYIFHRGASGRTSFLLPVEGEEPPLVKAGQTLALPEDGYLEFVEPPGEEELLVIAAKQKVADLGMLMKILNQTPEQDNAAESSQRKGLSIISKKMRQRNNKKFRNKLTLAERSINADGHVKAGGKEVHGWFAERAVIQERAGGKTDATLAVVASNKDDKPIKMLVSIPLKSVKKK